MLYFKKDGKALHDVHIILIGSSNLSLSVSWPICHNLRNFHTPIRALVHLYTCLFYTLKVAFYLLSFI